MTLQKVRIHEKTNEKSIELYHGDCLHIGLDIVLHGISTERATGNTI